MKQQTPITAGTGTGAVITTAEAMETLNPIIRLQAVDLKEIHHDLPFVPDRLPEVRKT